MVIKMLPRKTQNKKKSTIAEYEKKIIPSFPRVFTIAIVLTP